MQACAIGAGRPCPRARALPGSHVFDDSARGPWTGKRSHRNDLSATARLRRPRKACGLVDDRPIFWHDDRFRYRIPITEAPMAARALASVTVSFGMVSIPVKLYTATQAQAGVSFNLLHAACGSRLKQQYLCAREGVVVERADMVKGYEFSKDQYVTFTPEELKELEEKGTQTIEISEFVPAESIDPI